jgi:outer membrane lipoprotein SlyB
MQHRNKKKENTMSAPQDIPQKHHPMMIVAAIAVALFCAVGIAAMMGWLPSSTGGNANDAQTHADAQQTSDKDTDKIVQRPIDQRSDQRSDQRQPDRSEAPAPVAAPCSNCGVVQSVREIMTRGEGSGVGAAGGAVVGGLLGNQVGGGQGRQLATIAGAIGGAVAGNQIEGNVKPNRSYDIVVKMENGATRTIHQSAQPRWSAGDPVRIVNGELRSDR